MQKCVNLVENDLISQKLRHENFVASIGVDKIEMRPSSICPFIRTEPRSPEGPRHPTPLLRSARVVLVGPADPEDGGGGGGSIQHLNFQRKFGRLYQNRF